MYNSDSYLVRVVYYVLCKNKGTNTLMLTNGIIRAGSHFDISIKVPANEDTLLLMMLLGLRKLGNICCGHKMFLNKIRNIFVSRT